MLLSPRKNGLTSLFKDVRVFKEIGSPKRLAGLEFARITQASRFQDFGVMILSILGGNEVDMSGNAEELPVSDTKISFSNLSPKITLHVFVCDSWNYMETFVWNSVLGNSNVSYSVTVSSLLERVFGYIFGIFSGWTRWSAKPPFGRQMGVQLLHLSG